MLKKWILFLCLITSTFFGQETATIPILDMEDFRRPETREKFVQQLYNAFQDLGFIALANTGIEQQTLDDAYGAMESFFHQAFEKKMEAFDPDKAGERGYTPGESAKGHAEKDFKEFYSIGRELNPCERGRLKIWQNIWPEEGEFQDAFSTLYQTLDSYKVELEKAIASAIGIEENTLTQMTQDGDCLLRAIHYPENPAHGQLWAAEHTDIGLMTLLPRATAEGLQVQNKEGEWIDVIVPEDAFIINVGDMLQNMTNGEFRSSRHRVVAKKEGYERYSVVFFVHPKSDDAVSPLPQCIERTGGVQKFPDATRLELLEERLVDHGLASRSMMEHLAESGLMDRLVDLGRASLEAMERLKEEGLASEKVLAELVSSL